MWIYFKQRLNNIKLIHNHPRAVLIFTRVTYIGRMRAVWGQNRQQYVSGASFGAENSIWRSFCTNFEVTHFDRLSQQNHKSGIRIFALESVRHLSWVLSHKITIILLNFLRVRRSCVRCLRTSQSACGMEAFFPPGVLEKGELAPESVKTGTVLCTSQETVIMLQCSPYYPWLSHLRSIICQVVAYGGCKTKDNFKLLALKVVAVARERWSLWRGSK